jgi:carboxylate-amine ligase
VRSGCIPDGSKIWWDCRPHHKYPTLEFRVCDICTRIDEAIAIAGLFQAIVLWLWNLRRKNITFRVYRTELIDENRWRAGRYGIDGKMIDFGKSQEVPTRQLVRELIEMVGDEIAELGIEKHIKVLDNILMHGTSADRQLRIYDAHDGDLNAVERTGPETQTRRPGGSPRFLFSIPLFVEHERRAGGQPHIGQMAVAMIAQLRPVLPRTRRAAQIPHIEQGRHEKCSDGNQNQNGK